MKEKKNKGMNMVFKSTKNPKKEMAAAIDKKVYEIMAGKEK